MHRITFNEITKTAVKDSLKHPRETKYESGGCTAGKAYAGPYGGLYHQSAFMGKGEERLKCRTGTVCSSYVSSATERMRSILLFRKNTGAWTETSL